MMEYWIHGVLEWWSVGVMDDGRKDDVASGSSVTDKASFGCGRAVSMLIG
jgi:hypothetical protein